MAIFVAKSAVHGRDAGIIVYVSTLWSIFMIANRAVTEDRRSFKEEYQKGSFRCRHDYFFTRKGYFFRVFYRLYDVFFRLSVVLLIWLFIGGLEVGVVLMFESSVLLFMAYKTDELSCPWIYLLSLKMFLALFFHFFFIILKCTRVNDFANKKKCETDRFVCH